MQVYLEDTGGAVSEVWKAEQRKEFKPTELTPMYAQGWRHFYVNEVSRLNDGQLVVALAWI
jgi:hypothetical protein